MWLVIVKCLWWRMLLMQVLTFILVSILLAQSEVLGLLTNYFSIESPTSDETRDAYIYASLLIFSSILLMFINYVFYIGRKMGGMVRIILTSAIYCKVFRLSQTTISRVTMGHVINVASNDVHRFDECVSYFPFLLVFPIHLSVVVYLLFLKLEWSSMITLGINIIFIPLTLALATIYSKLRYKAAKVTDRRVKVMNEVISGMRVIKMYGWEYAFSQLVSRIRRHEIWFILASMMIKEFNNLLSRSVINITMLFTFSVFTLFGGILTPGILFSTLANIFFLRYSAIHFSVAMVQLFDAQVGYKRIKEFLLLPELSVISIAENAKCDDNVTLVPLTATNKNVDNDIGPRITVDHLTASWSMDICKPTLLDISFNVDEKDNALLAVVGPVGSGKSTLLQCLLKELPALSGTVSVRGSIGYASQEACVFSTSLRENILFGLPYEDQWYRTVVHACALENDISLLENGDLTLVGERGVTLSGGQKARVNLARAVYRKADIYLLDDPLSAVDSAVSRHIFEKCICGLLAEKCVVLVTHQTQYLMHCHSVLRLAEGRSVEGDSNEATTNQVVETRAVTVTESSESLSYEDDAANEDDTNLLHVPDEERAHGTVSMKTYCQYFKAGGGYLFTALAFGLYIITEAVIVITDWWIADWSQCSVHDNLNSSYSSTCLLSNSERVQIYSGLTAGLIALSFIGKAFMCGLLIRSAQVLHNRMFSHVLRAPIYFFDTNPIGQILNRFSKDIGFMDDTLVSKLSIFFTLTFQNVGLFLISVVANYYLIILVVIILVAFIGIRWYYLKTARDIKRLEAIARSPIYSHLSLTLQGLSTIRSYSMESIMIEKLHQYQNQHTQSWYLFIVTARWFSTRLDFLIALFLATFVLTSVGLSQVLDPALLSLTLTYSLQLTDVFAFYMRTSTEVESLMVSPERVIAYGKLKVEASLETLSPKSHPPPNWPDKGNIVMNSVSYKHSVNGPQVLNDISCTVISREKVGIVGRTGAGKTSLVSALFRLEEPAGGSIVIDGVDICTIGLHELRRNISIIPQDPVLFGGTIRYNLDPFDLYDESDIWRALEQVQLKSAIEGLDEGLLSIIREGGSNFSVGQRQLFCLARALLRKNPILVLDEATANVDIKTDSIIQEVIREQFSECTILTVAHRLNTVMDYDKIMVLDKGVLVEYDEPYLLLSRPSSYLGQLVDQTGPINANKLRNIAFMIHEKKLGLVENLT
ncbi:PREDICTED: multidrug resistance-associated protein 4-like isoform X2 [Amphimedon queenslandica]|nr:PREDICTED: multidrug resistance-associated protein 4-like isoform X2 [Amphimedon queenslandica]|eukprot:XP_019856381.1 PREDICTED: multidrug resistance-associated protein 4-like isoform X2 [Amphimedon queenslandica]